jgi:hypothetical protein
MSLNKVVQAASAIPYQAVARNNSGNPLTNQSISVRFNIRDVVIAGPIVYQETHSVITNSLGLFTANIGQGSSTIGTFATINWSIGAKFLQVEMDTSGGSAFIDMGTQQMLSVPFAMYAEKSGSAVGAVVYAGTWDANSNSPPLVSLSGDKGEYHVVSVPGNTNLDGTTDWNVGDWAIHNGTKWEKVDNTDQTVAADDVAFTPNGDITSANVQDALVEIRDETDTKVNAKVNRSGDTMTGDLILHANPTLALGAVTKQYVDSQFGDLIDSYIHRTDDGVSIYLPPGGMRKYFGIGETAPEAPLGIKADSSGKVISIGSFNNGNNENWNFGDRAISTGNYGLNIEEENSGPAVSRFFIEKGSGMIGIGTTNPSHKLHIEDSIVNDIVGLKIRNKSAVSNQGWLLGHIHDSADVRRNGRLEIKFDPGLPTTDAQLIILPSGNVGVNESEPDVKLHVSRPLTDPEATLDLIEGTGIVVIGPITDNIVADFQGIQARHGEYIGSVLNITASTLNLQRLGGDVLFHGSSTIDFQKIIFRDNGNVGIGVLTPSEKMEIRGKFIVGNDAPQTSGQSIAGKIVNTSTITGGGQDDHRIGLQINCSGTWGGDPLSKNIGLYVKDVTGQSSNHSNIAAVLNGNTVIGDLTSSSPVGSDGKNVLVIQNGVSPVSPPISSVPNAGGVQVYSESDVTGTSVIHVMNGDGHVIRLSKQSSLTTPNNTPVSTTTYGTTEADVINNLRTRINELEAKLQTLGLLN